MGERLTSGMSKCIGAAVILLLIARPAFANEGAPNPRTGDEAVRTDKSDYLVSEPVRMTGSGFAPGLVLTLRIALPDGSSGDFPAAADGAGNLDFLYEPAQAGDYAAAVLGPDGSSLASLSFRTAAAGGAPVTTVEKPPFGKLPLAFVPNAGQTDERVRFSVQAATRTPESPSASRCRRP